MIFSLEWHPSILWRPMAPYGPSRADCSAHRMPLDAIGAYGARGSTAAKAEVLA